MTKKEEKDKITASFTIDDSPIFDALDNYFSSLPLSVLEEVRKQNVENGEDTEILDKAIEERKRKNVELEKKELLYQQKKQKSIRKSILKGIISGLFNNTTNSNENNFFDLSPHEKEEINNGNYEMFQFEEEELEDDDYYYEDE